MNNSVLSIATPLGTFSVPDGKPVIIRWKCKNKNRRGVSLGVGWLRRGEKPHTLRLVHSAFQTWDAVEQEYPASWTIWESSVLDVRLLTGKTTSHA